MRDTIIDILERFSKHQITGYGIDSKITKDNYKTAINAMSDEQLIDFATTVVTRDMLKEFFNSSYVISEDILDRAEMIKKYTAFVEKSFGTEKLSISKITGISELIEKREWHKAKNSIIKIIQGDESNPEVALALEYVDFLSELSDEIKKQLKTERLAAQQQNEEKEPNIKEKNNNVLSDLNNIIQLQVEKRVQPTVPESTVREQIANLITNMIMRFGKGIYKYGLQHLPAGGMIYTSDGVAHYTSNDQLIDFVTTLVVRDFLRSAPANSETYFLSENILKRTGMMDQYIALCASGNATSIRAQFMNETNLKEEYHSWNKAKEAIIDVEFKKFLKELSDEIKTQLETKKLVPQISSQQNEELEIIPNKEPIVENQHDDNKSTWANLVRDNNRSPKNIPQYATGYCAIF